MKLSETRTTNRKKAGIGILLAAALLLAGCGAETQTPADTAADNSSEETVETVPERPYLDDLGEFDFGGYEFRVLSVTYEPNGAMTIFDTEENGDVVNDSLYTRNREIEERFNILFRADEDSYENCYSKLISYVSAGEDEYDLNMLINRNAFSAALDGLLIPSEELTYLNLEKDYYMHEINAQMSIGGKNFFYYSDECLHAFDRAGVLLFNKRIASELDMDDYYDLVRRGEWTLDRLFADVRAAYQDLDGNGTFDENDRYGLISCADYLIASLYNGAGELAVRKDENDIPYFAAISSDKLAGIMERIQRELTETPAIRFNNQSDYTVTIEEFKNGISLFAATVYGRILGLRDMEDDFGLIPFPKYDTAQENYISHVIDGWLHVVPATCADPERTSVIMEALAAGTAKYVIPAYYDKALSQKALRDQDSVEMLDIVRDTRVMDLGECPWFETVRSKYSSSLYNKNLNFASLNASIEPKINALIEEAVAAAEKLN